MSGETQARRARLSERVGGSLRSHTARGMLINTGFSVGLQSLALLRGFLVAIFLTPEDYGVFAIIVIAYLAIGRLRQVGIVDKYIQQDDPDDEVAFQRAFTMEAIVTGGFWLLLMALTPLIAVAYQAPQIILPGLVSLLAMPAIVLQAPVWVFQRNMEFGKQRALTSIDPIVGVVVTVALAAGGAGYWAFVAGNVAGGWAAALVILRHAPYKLRLRYDRGTAREYVHFSKPLLVSQMSNVVLLQGTTIVARYAVGIAGIGAMSLANSVRLYTEFANTIISATMYPGICAVKDRKDLLVESFVKSNRLSLMWGLPVGIGVALFADDLLRFVLGPEWTFATVLFQCVGLVSAIGHIAFNWDSYYRALGDTRPIGRYGWISVIGWAVGPVPLMITHGLEGYSAGLFVVALVALGTRAFYVRRLFHGFGMWRHIARAVTPVIPGVVVILAVRAASPPDRSLTVAAAELVVYLGTIGLATWFTERALLREALGYLRRRRQAGPVVNVLG